jgi:hypothetical protein
MLDKILEDQHRKFKEREKKLQGMTGSDILGGVVGRFVA